ncbi:MAG TPA: CBS domain-containing protein [Vicinamibacteria bacterium]|jgi:CBS domain-containing protein
MHASEFDEAWDDDLSATEREEQELGQFILDSPIRDMEPPAAVLVPESASIASVIQLMLDRGLGAVLVQREGRTVGIFTERDVLRRVVSLAVNRDRPVSEVMTPDPESLGPDDGIAFALNRMVVGGFRHILIADDKGGAPRLLSQRDVVAFIVSRIPKRVLNLPPEPHLEARNPDGG